MAHLPIFDPQPVEPDFGAVVDAVFDQGFCIVPGFLPNALVDALRLEIDKQQHQQAFRSARIGKDSNEHHNTNIRSDQIAWLDGNSSVTFQFFTLIEQLRNALNRALYLGLWEYEFHFAVYPPGSHYKTHYDNFQGTSDRKITVITYLNPDWRAEHGGNLRIYDPQDELRVLAEVTPEAGTLVCFLSEKFPHEVLPTVDRDRYSITGWLRARPGYLV